MIAGSTRDQANWTHVCKPCERSLRVFQGVARPDEATAAIVILHRARLEELVAQGSRIRNDMIDAQAYGPMGRVVPNAQFQAMLEGF